MPRPDVDIAELSPSERLDLIEQLWDSLSPESVPITAAQRNELSRRIAALESGEMSTVPLEHAIAAIRAGRAERSS